MSDTKELLDRARARFTPPEGVMDSLIRRRARKQRNRRIGAAILALSVALLTFAALIRTFRAVERPAEEPTPSPSGEDIFANVHGWIVYGRVSNPRSIWAVNPTRPEQPSDQIYVSDGWPLAWSSDGSKLLIQRWGRHEGRRWNGLFVLKADGTEVRIAFGPGYGNAILHWFAGGSFSPDGSRVVYADQRFPEQGGESSKIYTVDSDGGTPRFLHASQRVSPELFDPAFSPDGQQIAYIAGWGDHDNAVWVMNADGSGARELADPAEVENPRRILGWSTDGSRVFFDGCCESGVWVVGADGSGLAPLFHEHVGNPYLSPDGSRIAYQPLDPVSGAPLALEIARSDGTHVQKFGYGRPGPWNPLPLSKSDREPTAPAGGATPFVYALVALGVVGVFVLTWRARRRTAAR